MLLYPWLRYCQGSDHEVIIEQLKYPSFFPHYQQLWRIALESSRFSR